MPATPGVLCVEPLGRGSSEGHGQPLLVPGLGMLGKTYKVICTCLLPVLDLEALERGYTVNQGRLPLMLDLGPYDGHYDAS